MTQRNDIVGEIEKELDDLLAEAPEHLSESTLKSLRDEFVAFIYHVLNALTTQKLQSAGAYNRFLENLRAEARMKMHERRGRCV